MIGPAGLLWLKRKADAEVKDEGATAMDVAFLVLLLLTSVTGLALMLVGGTAWVGPMLAIHLGAVLALFVSIPYGKFAHVVDHDGRRRLVHLCTTSRRLLFFQGLMRLISFRVF